MFSRLFRKPAELSLYRLITPRSTEVLGPWAPHYEEYTEVVGYSSLGHIFMRSAENDYAVLHPFKGAAKSYEVHSSPAAFEQAVLKEPGFAEFVLRPDHIQAIHKRLGGLADDEIYIPQPYPMIGGSGAPETYHKGNVWVFCHIVAQMGGLE
jgi:hypothetical protein